jgi:hypothetical protein
MGKKPLSIQIAQEHAAAKGGVCLSTEYVNTNTPLLWRCEAGHEFEKALVHIRNKGTWCNDCWEARRGESTRNPRGLVEARELAQARGFVCLSTDYKSAHHKLRWRCGKGHEWESQLNNIRNIPHGCAICSGQQVHTDDRLNLARARAENEGGECLSGSYTRAHDKMRWRCAKNHEWVAQYHSVVGPMKSWCPCCSLFKREDECRKAFELVLGCLFNKYRAPWLGRLELDGYNEERGIAFEYQGKQHYEVVPIFHHNGAEDLARQQERDRIKAELCEARGVRLIIVPYWTKDLVAFARAQLATGLLSDDELTGLLAEWGW